MDWRLLNNSGPWSSTFFQSQRPFVPNLRVGVVAPDLNLDNLALSNNHWRPDREVKWEPTLHTWGMLARVNAIEDILVELCCKVASKAMYFGLGFLHSEIDTAIFPERLVLSLRQVLELINIGVRQVSKSEHILASWATGIASRVYLHNVGKFIRMVLLLLTDATGHTLVGIDSNFVPEHL